MHDYKPGKSRKNITKQFLKENRDNLRNAVGKRHKLRNARKLIKKSQKDKHKRLSKARIPDNKSVEEIVLELGRDPDVEWAVPNYYRKTQTTPNDSSHIRRSSLFNALGLPEAWDTSTGNSNITIAVIDTGVDWAHQDLADNIWNNTDEIAGDGVDNDGNGFDDDIRGWDFVDIDASETDPGEDPGPEDNNPMDFAGHGTHVAGIIGAKGDNGIFYAGVMWDVSIMPLRAGFKDINGYSLLTDSVIIGALFYACDNGADIVNMSFGSSFPSIAIATAVDHCIDKGVLLVAAAGNNSSSQVNYPAGYPKVLSVASVSATKKRSSFSNYGNWVDIAAFGENIYSTIPNGGQAKFSGTSMAAPMVAGVAGLVKVVHPEWNMQQIATQLQATSLNINQNNDLSIQNMLGGGLVQANLAIGDFKKAPHLAVISHHLEEVPVGSEDGMLKSGESFTIKPTIRNFGTRQTDVQVMLQSTDPYISVTDNIVTMNTISSDELLTMSNDAFEVAILSDAPAGYDSALEFVINQNGNIVAIDKLNLHLNPLMNKGGMLSHSNSASSPKIFNHADSSLTVLYINNGGGTPLLAKHRSPQRAWGDTVTISETFKPASAYNASVDSQDRIHVAYQGGPDKSNIIHTIFDPATGLLGPYSELTAQDVPKFPAINPVISLDSNDNPHVAWVDLRSGTHTDIYTSSFDGSSWSSENLVASFAGAPCYLDLFIDQSNNRTLLWGEESGPYSFGSTYDIYMMRNTGSGFQAPEKIISDVWRGTSADIDPSGIIHLIYATKTGADILYTKYNGISWTPPFTVKGGDMNRGFLGNLTADGNGNLHIIHKDQPEWPNGELQHFRIDNTGTGWQPMKPLILDRESELWGHDIDISVSNDGQVYFVESNQYEANIGNHDIVFYSSENLDESLFSGRPLVTDEGAETTIDSSLSSTFSPVYTIGSVTYQVAAGTFPGGTDILDWTQATEQDVTIILAYPLQFEQSYYVSIKSQAENGLSETGVSDGIRLACLETDTDLDGICDPLDICPGGDDNLDSDSDGVPDFCDQCPLDNPDDPDNDGVCTSNDICLLGNDNLDINSNGTPDDCDPAFYPFSASVVSGIGHTLAIKTDGTLWAWGRNYQGQLGIGTSLNNNTPVQVPNFTGAVAISANQHSLAVKNDGTVWAWGLNGQGQLGDGSTTDSLTPIQVTGLNNIVDVAAGTRHSLALKSDGTVWAWGANELGQLGIASFDDQPYPVQVLGLSDVVKIAANKHSFALKNDGTVWGWGGNSNGTIGDGATANLTTPVQALNLSGIIDIAAGDIHSAALKNDGTVWTWGANSSGGLGDGTTASHLTAELVPGLANIIDIAVGLHGTAAIDSSGNIWVWGSNSSGQLGNGEKDTDPHPLPLQVPFVHGSKLSMCSKNITVLRPDGLIWAWGLNSTGQIGNGSISHFMPPFIVKGPAGVNDLDLSPLKNSPLAVTPPFYDFGSIPLLTSPQIQSYLLTNKNNSDLSLGLVTLAGTNKDNFAIVNNTCASSTLPPANSCNIEVEFSPQTEGVKNAQIHIPTNAPDFPLFQIPLHGIGIVDIDGDGVADSKDICPGFNDKLDADADGVPDGCDTCPGYDDTLDGDADGVSDGCDICAGYSDAIDTDLDGVPDGCDTCPGFDDKIDMDNDGVPDNCDSCPGFDDTFDADLDGVPDSCDPCPFDNPDDTDGDGICQSIDICLAGDDRIDTDEDGIPDGCDICPVFDDRIDTDADGVPNGCDSCPLSKPDDIDADNVCDNIDICLPGDNGIDTDGDGMPDICDFIINDSSEWLDSDGDGIGDNIDNCIGAMNNDQLDSDNDARGDKCDSSPNAANYGSIIDAPHNQTRGITCSSCHSYSLWWRFSPVIQNDSSGVSSDLICQKCHVSNKLASPVMVHSSAAMGAKHRPDLGEWASKCVDCHNPHFHDQLKWKTSNANELYLVTGAIGNTFTVAGGQTTFSFNYATASILPGWEDTGFWGRKNEYLPAKGLILVDDIDAESNNTYEIVTADTSSITVKGGINPALAGKSFGIIYGQLIKTLINTPASGKRNVKFFNPKINTGGYTDDNVPVTGICQVCHQNTAVWNSAGSLTDTPSHSGNGNTQCTDCHIPSMGFTAIP